MFMEFPMVYIKRGHAGPALKGTALEDFGRSGDEGPVRQTKVSPVGGRDGSRRGGPALRVRAIRVLRPFAASLARG